MLEPGALVPVLVMYKEPILINILVVIVEAPLDD
jgi:hypothetical protein